MTRPQLAALIYVLLWTLTPCASKTQTLQDAIDEACAPSNDPLLLPCRREMTFDELNSRLNYKLAMMKKDELFNSAFSYWGKTLTSLYVEPTQMVWVNLKNVSMTISSDAIKERLSKAIDAEGEIFLMDTNGNPDVVRKHILWYLMGNGMDKDRVQLLQEIIIKIEPTHLFQVVPSH